MRAVVGIDLRTDGHTWLLQRALAWSSRAGATIDLVNFAPSDDGDRLARLQLLLDTLPEPFRGRAWIDPAPPAEGLVQATETADLLVVGSREPAALERWIHGPMATRVLRQARCPVLVPRAEQPPAMPARLLVGLDIADDDGAARVMGLAATWAQRFQGRVSAAYAVAQSLPHIADKEVRERAEREWEALHAAEKAKLVALLREHVPEGPRGEALLLRGEPDDALIQASSSADLVVVGNREREGLARLLGTVAQRVVRQAASDVLSLPTASMV
jgi:nucleotide-binding universal stress UspA family protein